MDFLLKRLKFINLDTKIVTKSQDQSNCQFLGLSYFNEFCKAWSFDPYGFNNYITNIFFALKGIDICHFPDDATLYICSSNLEAVLEKIESNSEFTTTWLEMSHIKLNADKCHSLMSTYKNETEIRKVKITSKYSLEK